MILSFLIIGIIRLQITCPSRINCGIDQARYPSRHAVDELVSSYDDQASGVDNQK